MVHIEEQLVMANMDDFQPRSYQTEMARVCIERNTIIYLPTGSGKTHIALMVLREMAADLQKPLSEGGKRSIFICNTVALAKQQHDFIAKSTPLTSKVYTSESNVDAWGKGKWVDEFEENQVIVCTAQVILDVLKHKFLSLRNINLLIFDECHHGVGDHPMHAIMEQFELVKPDERPRVIGLSGMLLFKQLKNEMLVPQELVRLENAFISTIATVGSFGEYQNVLQFSTNPKENVFRYTVANPSETMQNISAIVTKFLVFVSNQKLPKHSDINIKTLQRDRPNPIKELEKLFKNFLYQMEDLGLFGASIAILGVIVQLELDKRNSDSMALRTLYRYCITKSEEIRHILVEFMKGFSVEEQMKHFSTHKFQALVHNINAFTVDKESNEIKCLIFVERRFSAKVIYHLLKMHYAEIGETLIKPDFMVGNNAEMPETIENILEAKINRRVLEKFKTGETNVIITTNVLEEGIDLQMCNYVVKYDAPKTFASYVQSKGRARMKDSQYMIMENQLNQTKLFQNIQLWRRIEKKLQDSLVGKTINRPEPDEGEVAKELYDQEIPPFYTKCGARLDALSAIQLLNRYSMAMPRDSFTNTNITWKRIDLPKGKIQVQVFLPLNSKIKEPIEGLPKGSVKMAKRSAAFNACRKLYEIGELQENLIPVDGNAKLREVSKEYFSHWNEYQTKEENPKLAGTTKNVRVHTIAYPIQLSTCTTQPGRKCFVYILKIGAGFDEDPKNDNINTFRNLYNSKNDFAIMTTKRLPELAQMKFFVTIGMILGKVDPKPIEVTIKTNEDMKLLRNFHAMLFRDLLQIWKTFWVFDHSNDVNGYFIVPMKNGRAIDWELVNGFQKMEQPRSLMQNERRMLELKPENFYHKVVFPTYRSDKSRYVVTRVRDNLTPRSEFPNSDYNDYASYFEETYHIKTVHLNDFLIEVKGITTHLNLLSPGGDEDGRSAKVNHWSFQEILIPEFCHNYNFPADYWLKATVLPSFLHRFHYLLVAENIRDELATVGIGSSANKNILPLDVDTMEKGKKQTNMAYFCRDDDEDDDDDDLNDDFGEKLKINSITFPNPETTVAKLLDIGLKSYSHDIQVPWREEEEPIDIDRHWDTLQNCDLDYYMVFKTKFEKLSIGKDITTPKLNLPSNIFGGTSSGLQSICDKSFEEKFKINILSLTMESTKNVNLQQKDIIKALTTSSAGDVYNLERFEVLGDAFLKFAVSLYLVKNHPDWHEGYLTICKGKMVSNRNLLYCGIKHKISGMLKTIVFDPKNDFQPPSLSVPFNLKREMLKYPGCCNLLHRLELSEEEVKSGTVNEANASNFRQLFLDYAPALDQPMQIFLSQQSISDKKVADAMEGLLGVCVSTVGIQRSFNFLPYFDILPKENLSTLLDAKLFPNIIYAPEVDKFLLNHKKIEAILNYKFKNRALLLQALTHASHPTNRATGSYEQLEFLGDAVLDFLITSYIFEQCPKMTPGQLTDLRSALVNNVTLACILVRNYLHLYILSESASLTDAVTKFVQFQEQHQHKITDQVQLLVEEKDMKIADYVDVPKALGDVFESLIGAIFIDSGNDLLVTWKVIVSFLSQEILAFMTNTPINIVRQLYEYPGAHPKFGKAYVDEELVKVELRFTCKNEVLKTHGIGQNSSDAKKAAAKHAMQYLLR